METNYGIIIERLRVARGYKCQEDLVDGIVKLRTYSNYINKGDMPITIFFKLLEKMALSGFDVLKEIHHIKKEEKNKISALYHAIIHADGLKYNTLLSSINADDILDINDKKFYDYALLLNAYNLKTIHESHYKKRLEKLIDYPKCMEHKLYSFVELLILCEILFLESVEKQKLIMDKMIKLIDNESFLNTIERNDKLIFLIAKLANQQGNMKNNFNVINLCTSGIKICLSHNEFYLLEYFYYYASLSYHNLGEFTERNQCIKDCYYVLLVKKNYDILNFFIEKFDKDFNIDTMADIISHL